jgi:hypothetical protein
MNFHSAGSTGVIDRRLPRCEHAHVGQFGMRAQLVESDQARLLHDAHVDIHPARFLRRRFRVEIGTFRVELGAVGIGGRGDFGQPGDARLGAGGMVEQHAVADLHLVAHEVARLVVAHAPPVDGLFRHRQHVVDADHGGLGFHQPVTRHGLRLKEEGRGCLRALLISSPASAVWPAS